MISVILFGFTVGAFVMFCQLNVKMEWRKGCFFCNLLMLGVIVEMFGCRKIYYNIRKR